MGEKNTTKQNRKGGIIRAGVFAILLIAVTALAVLLYQSRKKQDEITAQLELQQDIAAALYIQQGEHEKEIQNLHNEIQAFLNIEDTEPIITSGQIMEQLDSVRELVTQQYIYTNAARRESNKTWLWGWDMPFSGTNLLVTYDGIIKAGIDLNDIQIDVNEDNRTITVTLPASKVTDNNIPQENINVLEVKDGLFNKVTFNDYNEFISAEKKVMEEKAIARGLLTDADNEARNIIKAFLNLVPGMDTYELIIK